MVGGRGLSAVIPSDGEIFPRRSRGSVYGLNAYGRKWLEKYSTERKKIENGYLLSFLFVSGSIFLIVQHQIPHLHQIFHQHIDLQHNLQAEQIQSITLLLMISFLM